MLNWIDAKERLPELRDGTCVSRVVLVSILGNVSEGYYDHCEKEWIVYFIGAFESVEYWCDFNQPKKQV